MFSLQSNRRFALDRVKTHLDSAFRNSLDVEVAKIAFRKDVGIIVCFRL